MSTGTLAGPPPKTAIDPGPPKRFTIDGTPELEHWLERLCLQAADAVRGVVPPTLVKGLLLGGGYGRGEGGVLRTNEGDRAYNDLEFYVLLDTPSFASERQYQPRLHHCGEQLTALAGLDVEFKACSVSRLRRSAPSMFYYDLVMGHRCVIGDDSLLQGCEHHRNARLIPISEATRLLMNRCSGLLFARERLARSSFEREDADFVGRNIAKAELALGDAVLTVHGQYHWSCLDRNRRLNTLVEDVPWLQQVQQAHHRGLAFKLHPVRASSSRQQLWEQWKHTADLALAVWLWLESRRLGKIFRTPEQYAMFPENRCPEVPLARSLYVSLRTGQWNSLLRYPRDRVLGALPLLLWCWTDPPHSPLVQKIQRHLSTDQTDFSGLVAAYKQLWAVVN